MMTRYEIALDRRKAQLGHVDTRGLCAIFVAAYNSGEQLSVRIAGQIARGCVDMLPGNRPIFILSKPGVRGHFWSLDASAEIL